MRPSALALLVSSACEAREPGPLVDPDAWVWDVDGADPFPAHRQGYEDCDLEGLGSFYVEEGVLEVATGTCGYLVLEQPSLVEVRPDDLVVWTVHHADLLAEDPAETHVAIALGDDVLWDWTVPIPSLSELLVQRAYAPSRAPEGTPVRIHLHNHGDNVWRFFDDAVTPR